MILHSCPQKVSLLFVKQWEEKEMPITLPKETLSWKTNSPFISFLLHGFLNEWFITIAGFPTTGDYTYFFIVPVCLVQGNIRSNSNMEFLIVYIQFGPLLCFNLFILISLSLVSLPPSGSEWACAREVAPRCLSTLGGGDRTVLKSHLRPLKRSLDTGPLTSGVRKRIQCAKVLTRAHHKGTIIGPWPSFEGLETQSQTWFGGKCRQTWCGKCEPSIKDWITDSLSCSGVFFKLFCFSCQMSSHSRYGDKGSAAAEDRDKRRNAGRNGTPALLDLLQ